MFNMSYNEGFSVYISPSIFIPCALTITSGTMIIAIKVLRSFASSSKLEKENEILKAKVYDGDLQYEVFQDEEIFELNQKMNKLIQKTSVSRTQNK
ncbi:MAG: hypothetical protein H0W88_08720 [Parachlamydiaceae bacterium]|nr:hypothetical protein [Parachlamydiaceae bacterium]